MRKTIIALAMITLFGGSQMAQASNVASSMDTLAQNYALVLKAESRESLEQGLHAMRTATEEAKEGTPSKLAGKSAESAEMQEYRQGLAQLIGQIDQALALSEQGKLTEAKAVAEEFKLTRNTYHKKFR